MLDVVNLLVRVVWDFLQLHELHLHLGSGRRIELHLSSVLIVLCLAARFSTCGVLPSCLNMCMEGAPQLDATWIGGVDGHLVFRTRYGHRGRVLRRP